MTLRGLHVRACANECFNSEHAESLAILSCSTSLQRGRVLAANNGGHNHHGAAVGQWVEGGVWQNAGDDTIHVSGLVMSVSEALAPTRLALAASYPDNVAKRLPGGIFANYLGVAVGHLLCFFDRAAGRIISRRRVVALVPPSAAEPRTLVTLDGDAGAITPGVIGGGPLNQSVTQVFNFNRTSNQFVFRRNVVRNGRRVGVLYKGHRAVVSDNTFEGLGGGALELWNAPYEGLLASTVLFRNNTVRDVCQLTSARVAAPVWSATFAETATSSRHSDLLVENNTFDSGPGSIFRLVAMAGALVRNNTVHHCASDAVIVLSNVERVAIRDNTLLPSQSARLCSNTSNERYQPLAPDPSDELLRSLRAE